jgi:hypothetical protein
MTLTPPWVGDESARFPACWPLDGGLAEEKNLKGGRNECKT